MSYRIAKFAIATFLGLATFGNVVEGRGHEGPCPALKGTMHDRGEKLAPHRLNGIWKVVYDQESRTQDMDCFTVKLNKDAAGLNETQLQVVMGHRDLTEDFFLYDDDAYFTFNHPEVSNMAAVETKEQLDDPGHLKRLASLDEDIKPLKKEILDSMKEEDRIEYEKNRQELI